MLSYDPPGAVSAYRRLSPTDHQTLWAGVAVVALLSGALGCTPQEQGSDDLTAQEEQALADTFEAQTRQVLNTFSELQPESYFRHVSEDFRHYYGGWRDRGQFENLIRKLMSAHQEIPTTLGDVSVEVLGPDAGVVTGHYRIQPVDTTGRRYEQSYAFTGILERRDGRWKLVRLHESLVQ